MMPLRRQKTKNYLLNNIDGLIKAAQYNKNRYVVGRIIIHEYGHLPSINGLCLDYMSRRSTRYLELEYE